LDEDALSEFSRYGYYSTDLKLKSGEALPNTKVISINSNACYVLNFQLLASINDPG
jgi:hypothetical protein